MLKLFRYLKNYKKESIIGPLFKLIEACFELAVPLVMANIIDVGIKNQDKPYIYKMGGVLILLAFCGLACSLTAQISPQKRHWALEQPSDVTFSSISIHCPMRK